MVGMKQAVEAAVGFVREMYPADQVQDVALEEVRRSEDERDWLVTIGFRSLSGHAVVSSRGGSTFLPGSAALERIPRDYKEVVVDSETGEIREMKIRDV